ncbi:MAG TPA: AMP-binding protein [Acidimicrobiales bacterium]|nr:AMP-binding protein [Acidimicrobiales bacterium]HYB91750.1 AMP-binding protein [Candidatus Binataceae bacterium]
MLKPDAIAAEPFDDLDRLSPAELDRWWERKLRAVFKAAARELPYYAQRFSSAGFDPAGFRTLADLRGVPISTKSDLLAAQAAGGSNAIGIEYGVGPGSAPLTLSLSSGTAGTTFITHTARWRRLQGRSSCRAHWWAGLRPGTPLLISAPAWHSYAAIQPFIAMHFGMPCGIVSGTFLPRFADRIVDAMVAMRPRFISMFLPMVFSVLAAAKQKGVRGDEVFAGVESMVVTGAPITPGMRDHLRQLTRVKRVAEIAGTSENLLAVDCARADGLHLVPDTCHAEVIDRETARPLADGERGAAVHSSVVLAGSVYLRYDGGDIAVMNHSPCPCGLPSPRIKLLGRREDSFTIGAQSLLPYDVQLALEQEVPELNGSACVITREGLAEGRLRLLLIEPERSPAALLEAARLGLARKFDVPVEITPVRDLPLRFKGVPPILSEPEAVESL